MPKPVEDGRRHVCWVEIPISTLVTVRERILAQAMNRWTENPFSVLWQVPREDSRHSVASDKTCVEQAFSLLCGTGFPACHLTDWKVGPTDEHAMRWLTFMLLVVVVLTLQSAVAPRLELFGVRPDWLLVVVVFFALYAPARDAAIGAWIIGGCAGLMTIERLGLIALSYTLVAMAVSPVREYLFRDRAVTRFIVTLLACLLVRIAWTIYCRVLYDPVDSLLVDLAMNVLLASVYTAAWAPLLHKGLWRMSRTFGLKRPRYTFAG
ncbi:MAG: rod shape-determining protein MreD [Phycisphaerae bacterium]